jgi:hypothetical protein
MIDIILEIPSSSLINPHDWNQNPSLFTVICLFPTISCPLAYESSAYDCSHDLVVACLSITIFCATGVCRLYSIFSCHLEQIA